MSTEDRITAVEQGLTTVQQDFLTNLSQNTRQMAALNRVLAEQELHTRDLDHNITILLGVASEQGRDIRAVKEQLEGVEGRLSGVEGRLGTMEGQLNGVETRLGSVEGRLGNVERRLESVDQRMGNLEQGIQQILQRLANPPTSDK